MTCRRKRNSQEYISNNKWIYGFAILKDPGTSDILHFVNMDGEIEKEPIWDFRLQQWRGTLTFRVDY